MDEEKHVVIIGAGVIGLQISSTLQEAGFRVTIVAKHFPNDRSIEYTSPWWAGAHWRSQADSNAEEIRKWDLETLEHMTKIVEREVEKAPKMSHLDIAYAVGQIERQTNAEDLSGLGFYNSVEFFPTKEPPWYATEVPEFDTLRDIIGPQGTAGGCRYRSVAINAPMYLGYLLRTVEKLGAVHIKADLPITHGLVGALSEAEKLVQEHYRAIDEKSDIWAFVNATGLSARHLVPDERVFPIRGHTVTVLGEASRITTINYRDDGHYTSPQIAYIIPRPHSNTSIIGGTKQANNWDVEADEKTTLEILERAKPWAWELLDLDGKFQIVSTQVGLRPGRKDGPRVEMEDVAAGYKVCHCYGHGGAGYQNSVGCANKVKELLLSEIAKVRS